MDWLCEPKQPAFTMHDPYYRDNERNNTDKYRNVESVPGM